MTTRVVMGVSYAGTAYQGWQRQPSGQAVQNYLEDALKRFIGCDDGVNTVCAGRTDAGVHAMNQVVHFDTSVERDMSSWVRATNRYLPPDIAVQWCRFVDGTFHVRRSAIGRRYVYIVVSSAVRPSLARYRVGWSWASLDLERMQEAASYLLGVHDFSAFRSSECQALTPIKHLRRLDIKQFGQYWRFEFEADAFLHHMIRNLMGELIAVGTGRQAPERTKQVLEGKNREIAAPTYAADGLYFLGPLYEKRWGMPQADEADMVLLPAWG